MEDVEQMQIFQIFFKLKMHNCCFFLKLMAIFHANLNAASMKDKIETIELLKLRPNLKNGGNFHNCALFDNEDEHFLPNGTPFLELVALNC